MQGQAMTEHQAQSALFAWAALMVRAHPELALLFAVPNAGKRSVRAAMYMKAEGLKPGVPDVWLPVPRAQYCGLVLELKVGKNKATEAQSDWLERLAAVGHRACVVRGWEEARGEIVNYLALGVT